MPTLLANTTLSKRGDEINTARRSYSDDATTRLVGLVVKHRKRDRAVAHSPGNDNKFGDLSVVEPVDAMMRMSARTYRSSPGTWSRRSPVTDIEVI